jgi:hypothetical protein
MENRIEKLRRERKVLEEIESKILQDSENFHIWAAKQLAKFSESIKSDPVVFLELETARPKDDPTTPVREVFVLEDSIVAKTSPRRKQVVSDDETLFVLEDDDEESIIENSIPPLVLSVQDNNPEEDPDQNDSARAVLEEYCRTLDKKRIEKKMELQETASSILRERANSPIAVSEDDDPPPLAVKKKGGVLLEFNSDFFR